MSSFSAGYGPVCAITDNGSDKCRVTFPAWDFDWELYDDIAVDSSHYIYNQNEAESQAITAKGGTESGGYWFDTAETFAGTNWTSAHRYVPTFQAAANDYNTITLAKAAIGVMDTMIVWYEDTVFNTIRYSDYITMAGLAYHAFGGLSRQRCGILAIGNAIVYTGDCSNVSSQITIRNFMISEGWSSYAISCDPTAGLDGAGAKFQRLVVIGASRGVYILRGTDLFDFENMIIIGSGYSAIRSQVTATFSYITAIFCGIVFDNRSIASTWINCVAAYSTSACFSGKNNGTYTTCASSDATGTGALINLEPDDLDFWHDNANGGFTPNPRILTTSSLYQAGTPVAGITKDIDGNTRDASNPSIGAHEGTATAYDMVADPDFPDVGNVTDDDTVDGVAGTFAPLAEEFGKLNEQWGEDGIEFTGAYTLGAPPATPAYADPASTRADGQVTLHIVPDDEADVVYARYKLWNPTTETWGAWTAEDEALKVTGTGDIAVGSLTNHSKYRFAIYAKTTTTSEWVITENIPFATVAVTANGVIEAELEIKEAIEFGTLAFTPANTAPEV